MRGRNGIVGGVRSGVLVARRKRIRAFFDERLELRLAPPRDVFELAGGVVGRDVPAAHVARHLHERVLAPSLQRARRRAAPSERGDGARSGVIRRGVIRRGVIVRVVGVVAVAAGAGAGTPRRARHGAAAAAAGPVGARGAVGAVGTRGAVGTTPPRGRAVQVVVRGRAEDHQPEETQAADFPASMHSAGGSLDDVQHGRGVTGRGRGHGVGVLDIISVFALKGDVGGAHVCRAKRSH
mmetsp:Transcript_1455/g.6072  ORF Transcript_1455/g.6072 Transcript_1455/m.6072 type:complete len:238 (+) Transcript_1455:1283-1996(+)